MEINRRNSESARERAQRQNYALIFGGAILLGAFVLTNLFLLSAFHDDADPPAEGDPHWLGPLMRERLRKVSKRARGLVERKGREAEIVPPAKVNVTVPLVKKPMGVIDGAGDGQAPPGEASDVRTTTPLAVQHAAAAAVRASGTETVPAAAVPAEAAATAIPRGALTAPANWTAQPSRAAAVGAAAAPASSRSATTAPPRAATAKPQSGAAASGLRGSRKAGRPDGGPSEPESHGGAGRAAEAVATAAAAETVRPPPAGPGRPSSKAGKA